MNYSLQCLIKINGERVILANRESGQWIKISKQCFDILELGIKNRLNYSELLSKMSDEEDQVYFSKLIQILEEIELLYENDTLNRKNTVKKIYFNTTS